VKNFAATGWSWITRRSSRKLVVVSFRVKSKFAAKFEFWSLQLELGKKKKKKK
jgi:hypothetical protein